MGCVYAIDGLFLTQRVSGIQRYSHELLAALDPLLPPGRVEIAAPCDAPDPGWTNIPLVRCGHRRGLAWQQMDYPRYLRAKGRRGLATCNVVPLYGFEGLAWIHDVCYRARPDFYTAPRDRLGAGWHRLQYRHIARTAARICTDSEFSSQELCRYYPAASGRVQVIYGAWQQMQRIEADPTVFEKWPKLSQGEYYYTMANLLKNKNLPWILQAAKAAPQRCFAVAGGGDLRRAAGEMGLAGLPNVVYLGYVSDGEAKALMAGCRAFLFPTLYEGFGMPPMEAVACGAPRIIVSDTPCMREVYGPYAAYIDPNAAPPADLDALRPQAPARGVLPRYSWQESARVLAGLLEEGA